VIKFGQHFAFIAHYADVVLHGFLQVALHRIRIFAAAVLKRFQRFARVDVDLFVVDRAVRIFFRELRREFSGAFAEDNQVGERISAEPICTIDSGRAFTGGK
jgi:hypothetical protein